MKIIEEEIASSGKKRIVFAVGLEDIELLRGLLNQAKMYFPRTDKNKSDYQRINNMQKTMSVFLGKSKKKEYRGDLNPCPYCKRHLRGEKAVTLHIKDVHGEVGI